MSNNVTSEAVLYISVTGSPISEALFEVEGRGRVQGVTFEGKRTRPMKLFTHD